MDDSSIIFGRNPVRETLERDASRIEKVILQKGAEGRDVAEIRRLASQAGVQVQYVPAVRLTHLTGGGNHQGVAAVSAPLPYADLNEMLGEIAATRDEVVATRPRILILDGIQDPYNFGAILRSAVASGTRGVIVPERNMAPLNAAALKASAGTAGRIPIARVTNVADTIYELKERGYWIAGADSDGDTSVWEMDWDRPLVLVVGSEGEGIRRRVLEACDYRLRIPMKGPAESLNASVAAGIILFAATRTGEPR
jgi:23S rRNA (guanosine2251-2'-O)-methyltransferase